jgi:hypothetical protein
MIGRYPYLYAWMPLAIVATVVVLALPWLGLIALMVVALVAVPALAFAIVVLPYLLIQAINRRLHSRSDASPATAPAASQPSRQNA